MPESLGIMNPFRYLVGLGDGSRLTEGIPHFVPSAGLCVECRVVIMIAATSLGALIMISVCECCAIMKSEELKREFALQILTWRTSWFT